MGTSTKYRAETREYINRYKLMGGCVICGSMELINLTFHHLNPENKEKTISELVNRYLRHRLFKELKKCVVICRDCHNTLHHKYGRFIPLELFVEK